MKKKMPELRICIGLSASGKSTFAKEFVGKNDNWCIVSRDDLRYAWQNKGVIDDKLESIITKMVKIQIDSLLNAGVNVLYDASNLKASKIKQIAEIARHSGVVTYQIFDVPKNVCIARDKVRKNSIGAANIERQYKEYLVLLDSYDFRPIHPFPKKYAPPADEIGKKAAYIFDIDGTIAHTSGKRSPYDLTTVSVDDCDSVVKDLLMMLGEGDYIIIVTGRDDSCEEETKKWLKDNRICYDKLLMRKVGDNRKDYVVKEEIFWNEIYPEYNVRAVFDDRDSVVEMWRSLGIKTFQCEYGNF